MRLGLAKRWMLPIKVQLPHSFQNGEEFALLVALPEGFSRLSYRPVPNLSLFDLPHGFASLTALFIGLIIGPAVVRRLREFQIGQYIREDGPKDHLKKAGTPTMGGVLIVVGMIVPTLLWADLSNRFVWIAVLATAGVRRDRLRRRLFEGGAPSQSRPHRARQAGLPVSGGLCDRRHSTAWKLMDSTPRG